MIRNRYLRKLSKQIASHVRTKRDYALAEIVEELSSYMKENNISARDILRYPKFISLYSAECSPSLRKFYDETNFLEEVRKLRERIKNSKSNLKPIQVQQINALMKYDALDEDKLVFSNYILEQTLKSRIQLPDQICFSYKAVKKAFVNVVNEGLRKICPGKFCKIKKDLHGNDGKKWDGLKTPDGIMIDENLIKELYHFGNLSAIEAALHEAFHIYQDVREKQLFRESNPITIAKICGDDFFTIIDILKDGMFFELEYYYNNYDVHALEKEADIRSLMALIKYLDSLNLLKPVHVALKDEYQEWLNIELAKQKDNLRSYEERKVQLDDLVLENQIGLSLAIYDYPVLKMRYIEYINEFGRYRIREKTSEELLTDYNGLEEHNDKIDNIYRQLIQRAESRSTPKSDEPVR